MFGVYRKPDLSDKIFYCLSTATAKVQSVNRQESFLFVCDVNAQHEEWLESSKANLHGRAVRDFASISGLGRWLRSLHIEWEGCLTWC